MLLTRNSSSSDWSRFSVNQRGYTGDPKHTRICIISLLGDTEELNISQSILFINVIFNEIYSRLSQLNRTFALSIKAKWIIRIITV